MCIFHIIIAFLAHFKVDFAAGETTQKKGEFLHEPNQLEADTATPTNRSRAATPLANEPLIPTHPVNVNPIKVRCMLNHRLLLLTK